MSNSQFPTTLDAPVNPSSNDNLANGNAGLTHHFQHSQANDAIVALETKVGVTLSADANSLDYKMRNGGAIRKTVTATTAVLTQNSTDNSQVILTGKQATILQITTSAPAWVRLYCTTASQAADANRKQSVDPVSGSGLLLEAITAAGALTINLSPTAESYSMENPPSNVCPLTITNLDSAGHAITVSLVIIPAEG